MLVLLWAWRNHVSQTKCPTILWVASDNKFLELRFLLWVFLSVPLWGMISVVSCNIIWKVSYSMSGSYPQCQMEQCPINAYIIPIFPLLKLCRVMGDTKMSIFATLCTCRQNFFADLVHLRGCSSLIWWNILMKLAFLYSEKSKLSKNVWQVYLY